MVKECLQLDRDRPTLTPVIVLYPDSGTTAGIEPVLIRYGSMVCVYVCIFVCSKCVVWLRSIISSPSVLASLVNTE